MLLYDEKRKNCDGIERISKKGEVYIIVDSFAIAKPFFNRYD